MDKPIIKEIKGKLPGKTLAVICGIHGNEKVGVVVVKKMLNSLKIKQGKLFLIIANPTAVKLNKRYINKNLNRCFHKSNRGNSPEDKIARKIMKILSTCDAVLDLHAYNDKKGEPFVICSKKNINIARIFGTKIISFNWEKTPSGATDGYMDSLGKIGICLECGTVNNYKKFIPFTKRSVLRFLSHFNLISGIQNTNKKTKHKQILLKIKKIIKAQTNTYFFSKKFKSFELLKAGQAYLQDGKKKYIANKKEIIVFPRTDKKLGEEICIIGKIVKS